MKKIDAVCSKLETLLLTVAPRYQGLPVALSGGLDSALLAALIKPKFAISVELPGDEKYNEIEYAKKVVAYLHLQHIIVKPDDSTFDLCMKIAVKAIGRPIPHFNIFPLYTMYQTLNLYAEEKIVLGDGPDETMCGYARDLIFDYLYNIYNFEAFENYHGLIDKILLPPEVAMEKVIGKKVVQEDMTDVDIQLMRPDMDDMSNGIAKHFGITNLRPYQDNKEIDDFMYHLPQEMKIRQVEYGKYALRKVAEKYLPKEIVWRKKKVGGPVYPVNIMRGWMENGEFDKKKWLDYQCKILQS